MMRDAAHRNRIAALFMSGGERNLQLARAQHGIIEKQLVEIAQTKKEDRARMLSLQLMILPEHGGGGRHRFINKRSSQKERALKRLKFSVAQMM